MSLAESVMESARYCDEHAAELAKRYPGQYLLVRRCKVVGAYGSVREASAAGWRLVNRPEADRVVCDYLVCKSGVPVFNAIPTVF